MRADVASPWIHMIEPMSSSFASNFSYLEWFLILKIFCFRSESKEHISYHLISADQSSKVCISYISKIKALVGSWAAMIVKVFLSLHVIPAKSLPFLLLHDFLFLQLIIDYYNLTFMFILDNLFSFWVILMNNKNWCPFLCL